MDRRPAAASAYTPPAYPEMSAFDVDPDPPTETFAPLPKPAGWPHNVDSRTAMDRLFDDLPSLRPEDAPFVPASADGTWVTLPEPEPVAPTPVEVLDVEPVEVPVPDDDVVAVHPEPVLVVDAPVTSGPSSFVPADDRSGKRQKHKPKKVDNSYEPSLGDDAPGGATTVVFSGDPDASLMEVRPSSDAVLTTSILQVISSNDDPLRMGVPTTLRRAVPDAPELSGDQLKAMTVAVRSAADRLRDEAIADDTRELREALRDVAAAVADIASRLP